MHSKVLTLGNNLCLLDQVVDVVRHIHKLLLALSYLLLSGPHQLMHAFREEGRLDSVNDVEKELLVDASLVSQVRQIVSDNFVLLRENVKVLCC